MIYTSELLCNYSFWSLSWQRSYIFVVCQLFDLVYEWQPIRSKWWKWAETIFKIISLLIILISIYRLQDSGGWNCVSFTVGGKGWTTVYLRVDTKKSHSHLQDFISHHQHVFALQEETLKTEYTNSADKGLSWLRESNTWIFYCHDNWCRVLPCNANTNNQLIWPFSNVAWLKYFSMSQARQQ